MGSGALAERQIDLAARACTVSCARRQPDPMDSIKLKGEENISRTIHENEIARAWKSTPTFDRSFARYPRVGKVRKKEIVVSRIRIWKERRYPLITRFFPFQPIGISQRTTACVFACNGLFTSTFQPREETISPTEQANVARTMPRPR